MNKQELIKAVLELPVDASGSRPKVDHLTTLELIKLLDEPDKVKVPQFVAEYIERMKNEDYHLLGAMNEIGSHKNKEIDDWFYTDDNIELFARAWIDGYEVEKEKRYTVVMKATKQPLFYNNMYEKIFFSMGDLATRFTRKQLEEVGLGWVFDCEGIEIEEVE